MLTLLYTGSNITYFTQSIVLTVSDGRERARYVWSIIPMPCGLIVVKVGAVYPGQSEGPN